MFFQGVLVTFSQVFIFTDHRLFNDVNFTEIGSLQKIAVKRKSAFALYKVGGNVRQSSNLFRE